MPYNYSLKHLLTHSKIMKAQIKTKSNFRGLNGQILNVQEISGTRVSCNYILPESNQKIIIDFNLSEIVKFIK